MASTSSSDPQSANDLLRGARFASTSPSPQDELLAPNANQLLSGVASLHPLAGLNDGDLDYLSLDDAKLNDLEGGQTVVPTRGWSDELCYGTGTTYLAGLTAGGLWGLREGLLRSKRIPMASAAPSAAAAAAAASQPVLKQAAEAAAASTSSTLKTAAPEAAGTAASTSSKPASAATSSTTRASAAASALKSPNFRVRLNTVLNSITRRGSFVGNNAGVLALLYNGVNSSLDKYRGRHDIYGSMLAGASTGLIWKSTAGVRPMFIASAGMTAGAALWSTIKPKLV